MVRAPESLAWIATVVVLVGCKASPPTSERGWFVDATEQVGLDFVHDSGARGEFLLPEIMGAGAALFDFDGDGDLDAYLVNGQQANRLYRQDGGRLVDVTATSGLGDTGYGMGVAVGDYDNDGAPDLFVTCYGPDRLYRNRGDGTFEDVTARAGVAVDGWSSSATFFDADLDGDLDLFVARYVAHDPTKNCTDATGRPDYCTPEVFPPMPAVLLRNHGDGTFTDDSKAAGIDSAAGPGLGVIAEDLDGDGWPDVYVANDGAANHLWVNARDGTFREQAVVLGAAYNIEGRAEAGMGIVAADFDGDLDLDLFLSHLDGETNTLYRNHGGGRGFEDATAWSGLGPDSLPFTGFGTIAADADLDGDLDLFIANGRVTRGRLPEGHGLEPPWNEFAQRSLLFLNRGDGRFTRADGPGAEFTSRAEVSRGLAGGDFDGDGDVDLLLANAHGRARLYLNQAPRGGSWLTVRAVDPALHRDAIGATVTLIAGGKRALRTISAGYGYLSSSEPRARFAFGRGIRPERLEVRWLGGAVESFPLAGVDREMVVSRGAGEPR